MITSEGLGQLGFTPHTDYQLERRDGVVVISQWNSDQPQPSESAIETAHAEWQSEQDSTQYQRDRAAAYASIGDQLDMQYHDLQDSTTTWADHVAEIKARFPK